MKKTYLLSILTFIFLLLPVSASAASMYDFVVNGVYYKKYYGTQTVVYVSPMSYSDSSERYTSGHTGDVVIPESVTYNGVTYPVTGIANYAFVNSSVTSVTIPSSVTTIQGSAFDGCSKLTKVINLATTPQTITANTFGTYGTLYVYPSAVDAYTAADNWKNFTILPLEASGSISIANASVSRGSAKSVDVKLENMAIDIVGFQFDLTLPNGVTPTTSSSGAVTTTATSRLGSSFTLRGKSQGNNTYRFAYLSTSGTGITGTSGSIFSISLNAAESVACGAKEATISNVTITGKDGSEITPDGSSFNITIPHTATAVTAKSASCTETGNKAYWYCSGCEKYFSNSACTTETTLEAMTIPAKGHSYSTTPTWTWTGVSTAIASFACANCSDAHEETATIKNEITTPATSTQNGVRTYTAIVNYNGTVYTDTKTQAILSPMVLNYTGSV